MNDLITRNRSEILGLADKYGAFNVGVFGSYARGDEHVGNDIHFLVDFAPGGDFDQAGLLGDVRDLLGCPADVIRASCLRARIKDELLAQARAI